MCGTCGCGDENSIKITKPGEEENNPKQDSKHHHTHSHDHHHGHDHDHNHSHAHDEHGREILIEQDVLQQNNLLAERNRGFFEAKNIFAINMVSSPGSGKTTTIEKTISALGSDLPFYIIEGDQQSMLDANRIHALGAPVVQVNTGSGCHLDADMVNKAVKKLDIKENAILIIENVGNLVCPAMFDLGETMRVVLISVTEGDDKPLKYPQMFSSSDICIINKTDLLPYLDSDVEVIKKYARQVNQNLEFIELSAKTEDGLDTWLNKLKELAAR